MDHRRRPLAPPRRVGGERSGARHSEDIGAIGHIDGGDFIGGRPLGSVVGHVGGIDGGGAVHLLAGGRRHEDIEESGEVMEGDGEGSLAGEGRIVVEEFGRRGGHRHG